VHSGDYVLKLTSGIGAKSTITDYVVTLQLAGRAKPASVTDLNMLRMVYR
jgi:hypothetical protein